MANCEDFIKERLAFLAPGDAYLLDELLGEWCDLTMRKSEDVRASFTQECDRIGQVLTLPTTKGKMTFVRRRE